MLTDFKPVTNDAKAKADKQMFLTRGNSPFKDGIEFTITGYNYVQPEENGRVDAKARTLPVFVTSVGNLFLSMITKKKVLSDGSFREPDGTFNKDFAKKLSELSGKTDGDILTEMVNAFKDKTIVVDRQLVSVKRDGREVVSTIINLNYKE